MISVGATPILRLPQNFKAVIFDTNVFLAFILGNLNGTHFAHCTRTKEFTTEDVESLMRIAGAAKGKLATTPYILTETSYFLEELQKKYDDTLEHFRSVVELLKESHIEAKRLMLGTSFIKFGLADTSLVEASKAGYFVISTDFGLIGKIKKAGGLGFNFKNLKTVELLP